MDDKQSTPNDASSTSGQGGNAGAPTPIKAGWFQNLIGSMYGDALVSPGGIVITATLLIALTVVLLYSITKLWPKCGFPDDNQNSNTSNTDNRSTSLQDNGNPSNARSANVNVAGNTNTTGNSNTAGNTKAATRANTAVTPPATTHGNTATPESTGTGADDGTGASSSSPGQASETNTKKPNIDKIEPVSGSIFGKTLVTIKGKNFGTTSKDMVVKFGEADATISKVTEDTISVQTGRHSKGIVDVMVKKGNESDTLPTAYTYTCPDPAGSDLFWMIIMAGALGGCIHAMRSLFWYAGQRELKWSWLPMYFIVPFIGAAMALIFGLLIAAGLFDTTPGENKALFMVAIAGLVGMFSQQAALKLTDIANAVFTKPGPGKDAKPQATESVGASGAVQETTPTPKIEPSFGQSTGALPVTITNTGLTDVASVTFGGEAATSFSFDNGTSTLTAQPPKRAAGAGEVDVLVLDAAGKTVKLKYTYL